METARLKLSDHVAAENYAGAMAEAVTAAREGKITLLTADRPGRSDEVVAAVVPKAVTDLHERLTHPSQQVSERNPHPVRIAEKIVVERLPNRSVRMWIDGELFTYGTLDGFSVHPRREGSPGVTMTVMAMSVEVRDSM